MEVKERQPARLDITGLRPIQEPSVRWLSQLNSTILPVKVSKLAARTTRVCGTSCIKFRGIRFAFPIRWTIYPAKAHKVCLTDHAVWARHTNSIKVHWPISHPNQGSRLFTLWQSEHPINRCLALCCRAYRDLIKDKGGRGNSCTLFNQLNRSPTPRTDACHAPLVPAIGESTSPLS